MNNYETEYSSIQLEEDDLNSNRFSIDTGKLMSYVQNEMGINLLFDKDVTYLKRYVDNNLIDIVFTYKNNMYIATYLQGTKDCYISNLIL